MNSQIRDCVTPDRNPRKPDITLPKGSIDTHLHGFEKDRYEMSPTRGYTPPDSTLADPKHLHATLGIDRVVFTQPSTYGTDNSAILDGMAALNAETPNRARGVAALTMAITDEELAALDAKGRRGVRLNTDNKGGMPITMADIPDLATRIKPFGWHIEFLFPGQDIVGLVPVFETLTVPMSIGRIGISNALLAPRHARRPTALLRKALRKPEVQEHVPFPFWDETLGPLESLGILDLLSGEHALTGERTTRPAPGHTPGSMSLSIASGGERALMIDDVVTNPAQVTETEWIFAFDMEPDQAVQTRKLVIDRAEADDALLIACHFPHPGHGHWPLRGK